MESNSAQHQVWLISFGDFLTLFFAMWMVVSASQRVSPKISEEALEIATAKTNENQIVSDIRGEQALLENTPKRLGTLLASNSREVPIRGGLVTRWVRVCAGGKGNSLTQELSVTGQGVVLRERCM